MENVYFNPRSHERSDKTEVETHITASKISIHAPTRGATLTATTTQMHTQEFQSTLPREERRWRYKHGRNKHRFQSTLPREERRIIHNNVVLLTRISIHAPTRGATKFQHHRKGLYLTFQSTLPREERRHIASQAHQLMDFNPRSHERSDHLLMPKLWHKKRISIHAPTRGATSSSSLSNTNWFTFQSTLPREERLSEV